MSDEAYTRARFEAAESLRRLGHALVAHRPGADLLDQLTIFIDEILPQVVAAPERPDPLAFLAEPDVQKAMATGDLSFLIARARRTAIFEDSIVTGPANPMSIAAAYEHEGDEVVARVVLGPAFEGAPGRAHGGIVAAIFDETMGAVLPMTGTLAYTGSLTINFRAPAPIGEPLEFHARIVDRDGRRISIEATGTTAGSTFADASGVFISVASFSHQVETPPDEASTKP